MARVTNEELNNSVNQTLNENQKNFIKDSNNQLVPNKELSRVFYNQNGEACVNEPDDIDYCGKLTRTTGNDKYEVKINRLNSELYQPSNKSYMTESVRYGKNVGQDPFTWARISERGFLAYIQYLMTKDRNYLEVARKGV